MSGKIALALGDYANNYGTVLQAFATFQKVRDLGYDAEAIDFTNLKKSIRNRKLRYFAGKLFDASVIKEKGALALKKFHKLIHADFKRGNSRRDKLFTQFRKNIKRSRPFTGWEDLSSSCHEYSAVLVGSDQVWLPSQIAGDFFTLNFVPDDVKRISYASSFGVSYYEKAQAEKARHFLSRINYLSVREQSGQEIIKALTGRDAELVCDPTLLLTADEWDTLCVNSNSTQQGGGRKLRIVLLLGAEQMAS
ncbi:MAG: polysaccharide pyruvyl transferase family protein [Synergistaceae bacterium]|nr:polysaccharide pyruvyl transferase family protein [Synergistaceae bacterium]